MIYLLCFTSSVIALFSCIFIPNFYLFSFHLYHSHIPFSHVLSYLFLLFYSADLASRVSLLMYLFQLSFILVFFLFVYPAASSPLLVYLIHERYWSLSFSNRSSTCLYAALISPIATDAPMEQFNSSLFYCLVYKRHAQAFNPLTRIPSLRRSPMYKGLLNFAPLFTSAK